LVIDYYPKRFKITKHVCYVYKIRNSEAPKESAKFLGHGFCDHITKSSSLSKSTSSSTLIFQWVCKYTTVKPLLMDTSQ